MEGTHEVIIDCSITPKSDLSNIHPKIWHVWDGKRDKMCLINGQEITIKFINENGNN